MTEITKPNETSLRLQRTYDAPAEDVFDAWTNPEVLRRWWKANPAWITPVAEVDLRVGGRYRISMEDPESGKKYTAGGEYSEMSRPNRLVYSWQWEQENGELGHSSTVAVDFRGEGEQTTVVLEHTGLRVLGITRLARTRLGRRAGGIPDASERARRTDVLTDARNALRVPDRHSRWVREDKTQLTNQQKEQEDGELPAGIHRRRHGSDGGRARTGDGRLGTVVWQARLGGRRSPATRSAHPPP